MTQGMGITVIATKSNLKACNQKKQVKNKFYFGQNNIYMVKRVQKESCEVKERIYKIFSGGMRQIFDKEQEATTIEL